MEGSVGDARSLGTWPATARIKEERNRETNPPK